MRNIVILLTLLITPIGFAATPVAVKSSKASSALKQYGASHAADGKISDASRWVSEKGGPHWLVLEFTKPAKVAGVHLHSGWQAGSAIVDFHIEYRKNDKWVTIASSAVNGNKETAFALPFDETVSTDALRFVSTDDQVRIKEIIIWPEGADVPKIAAGNEKKPGGHGPVTSENIPEIYLNQSGFNLRKPKRFTAPNLADGTPFAVHKSSGGPALYEGTINKHLGDFSSFDPAESGEYIVKAGGISSVPFAIEPWRFERVVYQPAIDFMVDSRHYAGNYKTKCGGSFGWRDDHHFAFELRTLVPQYLSNPAVYERMPKQITYPKPKRGLWGALTPYNEDAPDIVKLIHWGADFTVSQKLTHQFLKGELAYFLYAWPWLKRWLPQQNYDAVLKFAKLTWDQPKVDRKYPYDTSVEHNLFALKTKLGTAKGELPPGHSIMPNLMMYLVCKRDKLPNAETYFKAAHRQTEWIVKNLDWENPETTKGQRMSEHVTMTSLATFLQLCPDRAPTGLRKKIQDWAKVVVRRSDNMWDFRKLTDSGQWTPSGKKRTMWNEPGNVVGLPACLLAAAPFIDDANVKARLNELVWSHVDNCFGRNPCGRHFSYDAPRELQGVEHGWYSYHKGGIGKLADARFVLDGAPKHVHYPYHPEKRNYGWTEGWVNFNTAFNLSLAYMAKADTELKLEQKGGVLVVRLRAPLNFDYAKDEPVTVTVRGSKSVAVTLKEESARSRVHVGHVELTKLGVKAGDHLECTYGFGYMGTSTSIKLK